MQQRLKFIFVFITITLSGYCCSAQRALQRWDDRVMINLAENRTPQKTAFMLFLTKTYTYGDIGVPAALLAGGIIGNDRQMRENALYVASSTAITYGLNQLIKVIVKRPRPFVQNIKIVPVYHASEYSFPSGHTSSTISTATALSIAYPKWYVIAPAFLWAGSVSYSRMYLGVHYPTDVAGGAILGAGTAVSLSFLKANQPAQ
ncbi:phosphatase PAP2 family protein [Mucilaginibacter auburnensis]|uniref:Undecaprenyl-diphosphatase n=1 Tax=Mucilaginibacter auburnensis TaxID=1457233 RepID=A0A2H9VR84_9SPHI|nr:undecaprenyl-diphosphatase [Mucilaginibacter auburnensis]